MGGEGVSQGVRGNHFAQPGPAGRPAADSEYRAAAELLVRRLAREEPVAGPVGPPVLAQDAEKRLREHHVAILAALALADADGHASAVDVGDLQADDLGEAQAGGVEGHEDDPG